MRLGLNQAVVIEHDGSPCLTHVRALAAANATADSGRSGWVHLAMAGRWEGHPAGAFEFTPEVFAQMKANFDKSKTPVKFDYEHQTMNGQPGAKPASGHVKALELRDNGANLWGYVDWTPRAAELIKAGEYNFCSPVVAFRGIDKRTGAEHGAELLQVALTDDPFLDGQTPIQLSFTAAGPMQPQQPPRPPTQMGAPAPVPPAPQQPMVQATQPLPPQQPVPPAPAPAMAAPKPVQPPQSVGAPPQQPAAAAPPPPAAGPEGDKTQNKNDQDANALVDLLAEAAGGSRADVIKKITDNLDQVVAVIQKSIADKSAGAPSPNQEPRKMSNTHDEETARRMAALESDQKDASIVALSKRFEVLETKLAKFEAEEKERAAKAVEQRVDQLIADGYVEQAKRADAVWAFTADPIKAASIFSSKVVPLNVSQANPEQRSEQPSAGSEPRVNADGEIDVRSLSKNQKVSYLTLVDRYQGDKQRATKMFTKLNEQKGTVH